jgi:hypothetical protein
VRRTAHGAGARVRFGVLEQQRTSKDHVRVTETALSTALNTAYFAEQVALFSIVMGIALLLSGIGFLVLTLRFLRRVPDQP